AQQLESALRERDEAQQKLQEVLQRSQENLQAADASRTLSMENEALQQDLAQSREASKELQSRLQEAELQVEQRSQAIAELEQLRVADSTALQRLQGDLASIQETGASQAGQLESALRERDEAQQKLQELLQKSQETDQVADASRALSTENENLRQELAQSKQATTETEARLQEVTQQLHQFGQAITHFQSQHQADAATIQRLQGDLASTQEAGATQAGQLELALRERNDANQRLQEVLQRSQETSQVAHAGSTENERLRQELAQSREELMRCVAKLQDGERLQLEIRRLLPFEEASKELETRLREAELQLEQRSQAMTELQRQHAADAASIQRLQGDLLSIQETGESQAGQLESALLERNKECATLRRERNEAQQKLQEVLQRSQENLQVADAGRALSTENERLQQELAQSREELKSLNSVVERCVAKMEAESRERPFLVDKRMVTQMLAAYLEQRENPGPQLEILNKMADLLGFTSAEREQVGLSQKRKTPLQMQEPQGLADLTDRFVDFLMEESEAG
ncbi:LanA, partial [Symbiodinium microadriaticum]